jgi:hypothetical protein
MLPFSLHISNVAIASSLILTTVSLYIVWYIFKRSRLPPGLASLPLVTGSLPFVGAGFKVKAG